MAALIYETGDGNTPEFVVVPVMLIMFVLPVYVAGAVIIENVVGK
jgi:hypothetical protein